MQFVTKHATHVHLRYFRRRSIEYMNLIREAFLLTVQHARYVEDVPVDHEIEQSNLHATNPDSGYQTSKLGIRPISFH